MPRRFLTPQSVTMEGTVISNFVVDFEGGKVKSVNGVDGLKYFKPGGAQESFKCFGSGCPVIYIVQFITVAYKENDEFKIDFVKIPNGPYSNSSNST